MKTRFALLFTLTTLFACVGLIPAADIRVKENPVPVNSFARVSLEGVAAGSDIAWDVTPEPITVEEKPDGTLYFSGPPGAKYRVTADVIDWTGKKRTRHKTTVTMDGAPIPPVPPVPPVPPGPQPDPVPAGTVKRFVVVEDTAKAGAWRGDVLGSPKVASFYKASGLSHRLVDISAEGDDPAALAYQKLAVGKQLPWLWLCDADGKVLKDMACPTDPDKFVAAFDLHTGKRKLGAILGKPKLKWAKFGGSPSVPLIARDKWKSVNLDAFLPPVHDQNGVGQCASSSACSLLEWARALAGLPYVYLSAGDLYSRVNGGQDQGSMPEDNLNELLTNGVAPAANVPYIWNGRKASDAATVAARKLNRLSEAYLCDDFDALASAIQQGFACQIAIAWFDNFTPDADGELPNHGAGGSGGHALCAYGLVKLPDGTWALLVRNSWGASWGNSKDGRLGAGNCIIPESLFSGPDFGNVWACRAVVQTKSDFPVPKLSLRDTFRDRAQVALAW